MAGAGAQLVPLEYRDGWIRVRHGASMGWMPAPARPTPDRPAARPSVEPDPPLFWPWTLGSGLAVAGLAAALLLAARKHNCGIPASIAGGVAVPAAGRGTPALLVAERDVLIRGGIPGVYLPLSRCLGDLGFQVILGADLRQVAAALRPGAPLVIGIDCALGRPVLKAVEALAKARPELAEATLFFYNAAHPEILHPPASLPQAHYLGQDVDSRHLMEIVSPAWAPPGLPAPSGDRERSTLEGCITRHALAEILQFLEVGRRTGILQLETGAPAGVLVFEDGDITDARTPMTQGPDAVFEILAFDRGTFRFQAETSVGPGDMRLSATQLLLHWARRMDESQGRAAIRS
jgi:hypothetical protein